MNNNIRPENQRFTSLTFSVLLLFLAFMAGLPFTDAVDTVTLSMTKNGNVTANIVNYFPILSDSFTKYTDCGRRVYSSRTTATRATDGINCTTKDELTIINTLTGGANEFVYAFIDLNKTYMFENNTGAIYSSWNSTTATTKPIIFFVTDDYLVAYAIYYSQPSGFFNTSMIHNYAAAQYVANTKFYLINMTPYEVAAMAHVRYVGFAIAKAIATPTTVTIGNVTIYNTTVISDNQVPTFNVTYATPVCMAGNTSQSAAIYVNASDYENNTILYSINSFTDKWTSIADYVQFRAGSCKPDYDIFDSGKIQGNYTHNTGEAVDALQVFDLTAKIDGDCIGNMEISTKSPPIILRPKADLYKNWTFQTSFFFANDLNRTVSQFTYYDSLNNPRIVAILNNTGANLTVTVNGSVLWNKAYKSAVSSFVSDHDLITLLISNKNILIENLGTGVNENISYTPDWSLSYVVINSTPSLDWYGWGLKYSSINLVAYLYEYNSNELVPVYTSVKPTSVTILPSMNYYRLFVTDNAHPSYRGYQDIVIYGSQAFICTDGRYSADDYPDTMEKRNSAAGFFYLIGLMYGMAKNFPASPILASLAGLAGLIIFLMVLFATEFAIFKSLMTVAFYYFVMGFIGFFSTAYLITGIVLLALGIGFKLISESSGGA